MQILAASEISTLDARLDIDLSGTRPISERVELLHVELPTTMTTPVLGNSKFPASFGFPRSLSFLPAARLSLSQSKTA